jgi:hypothetical protein
VEIDRTSGADLFLTVDLWAGRMAGLGFSLEAGFLYPDWDKVWAGGFSICSFQL